jgi:hypothetical protein
MLDRRHLTVVALAGLNLAVVAGANAQATAATCADVADDLQRLACYDRAFGRKATPVTPDARPAMTSQASTAATGTTGTATAAAGATAAAAGEPRRTTREDFGLSEQEQRARAERRAEPRPIESITATVRSVARRPSGEQVFVMADGQSWMELEAYARTRVRAGDEVTIRRGALGSFMLVTPGRVATHVRRLK